MTSREAFEAWYVETFKHGEHLEKALLAKTADEYVVLSTHHIWMAWQAAERKTARRCAAIAERSSIQTVALKGREAALRILAAIRAAYPEAK